MRNKTRFFGVLACLLALGFMFVSCGDGVGVRDEAFEWGYLETGHRGRAPAGVSIAVRDIPDDFLVQGTASVEIWRIFREGSADPNEYTPVVGPFPLPPDELTQVSSPRPGGDPMNLWGFPRGSGTVVWRNREDAFSVQFANATVGNHLVRITLGGSHVDHDATITGRVFHVQMDLSVYNTISFSDFAQVYEGSRQPTAGNGDPWPDEGLDIPPSFPDDMDPPALPQ